MLNYDYLKYKMCSSICHKIIILCICVRCVIETRFHLIDTQYRTTFRFNNHLCAFDSNFLSSFSFLMAVNGRYMGFRSFESTEMGKTKEKRVTLVDYSFK